MLFNRSSDTFYFRRLALVRRYQLTAMVVDTEAGPHKNRTVLFLGSTRGTILKFLMLPSGDSVSHSSVFLEEVEGFNPEK